MFIALLTWTQGHTKAAMAGALSANQASLNLASLSEQCVRSGLLSLRELEALDGRPEVRPKTAHSLGLSVRRRQELGLELLVLALLRADRPQRGRAALRGRLVPPLPVWHAAGGQAPRRQRGGPAGRMISFECPGEERGRI